MPFLSYRNTRKQAPWSRFELLIANGVNFCTCVLKFCELLFVQSSVRVKLLLGQILKGIIEGAVDYEKVRVILFFFFLFPRSRLN